MPGITRTCIFGMERESWQMRRWEDPGSHLKREEKARVVPALSDQGGNECRGCAQLIAGAGRRQLRGAGHMSSNASLTRQQADTCPSFLLNLGDGIQPPSLSTHLLWPPSLTHPLLLLYCIPPVFVLSSSLAKVSHYPSLDRVAQIIPGDDCTQLFLSIVWPISFLALCYRHARIW